MKKFRFNYSLTVGALIALVILISGAGVVLNVLSVIKYLETSVFTAVSYGLLTLLTAALFSESVAIAFYGLYKVKGDYLYAYFGFVFTKTALDDITEVKVFTKTNKLVLYLKNGKFTVVIISPENYADFIAELKKHNPEIFYSAEESEPA